MQFEMESDGSVLGEFGGISLSVSARFLDILIQPTYQVQGASGVSLLISVLDEEQQALAGDAGPCSGRVRNVGLLTAQVLAEAGAGDGGLLAEPEVLLGEAECAGGVSETSSGLGSCELTS